MVDKIAAIKFCLICHAIKNEIPFDLMLATFGATALWQAQKENDEEQHHQEVSQNAG